MEMEGCLPNLDPVPTIEEMNQAVLDHAAELDAATAVTRTLRFRMERPRDRVRHEYSGPFLC